MGLAGTAVKQGRGTGLTRVELPDGASTRRCWWMGVWCVGGHAAAGGGIVDDNGHSWWRWRLTMGMVLEASNLSTIYMFMSVGER